MAAAIVDASPGMQHKSSFLQLVYALSSHTTTTTTDLNRWLDDKNCSVAEDDLRSSYPVLLNWSILQLQSKAESSNVVEIDQEIFVTVKRIVQMLRDATTTTTTTESISSLGTEACRLRMSLSGYLQANKNILQNLPVLGDLVQRDEPLLDLSDEPTAAKTMKMVNNDDNLLPGDACQKYIRESTPVLHPFTGEAVSKMKVLKVFDTSKTKPAWIRYFSDLEENEALAPDVIAKQGDDLRNDQAIRFIAKLCNALWAMAPVDWKLGRPPTVFCYDVLVASINSGYLQHVQGKTFFELSQEVEEKDDNPSASSDGSSSADKIGWDNVNIESLAPSLVGSYVAHFVLGTRDRHEHNMMVVGDLKKDPQLMQIDFGYVLMEYPGGVHFDTPRLTMPIPLIDRLSKKDDDRDDFSETSLMEKLQQDMLAAFLVLRKHAEELIHFSKIMLSTSHDPASVEAFFRGSHSLRTDDNESNSAAYFASKVEAQLSRFVFRREVRQRMVASYYTFYRGVEFSKNFQTKSKRRLLAKRAAEALHIPVRKTEPEGHKRGHRRSLSANDVPDCIQMFKNFGDEDREDNDVWYDAMQGSISMFHSFSDDEDLDDQRSIQSEPEFL